MTSNPNHLLVGQRFGSWIVTGLAYESFGGRKRHLAKCRCDCGGERLIMPTSLRVGQTTRCRTCANREKANLKPRLTHGGTETRLYSIWTQMRRRCQNPQHQDYHRYGGRGITICRAWSNFSAFRDWALGNGYGDHLTIDRRDNDRGYEPDNCRWISRPAQNRNRRDNRYYQWRGKLMLLPEIAEATGISSQTIRRRIVRDGWSVERAATQPPRGNFTQSPTTETVR